MNVSGGALSVSISISPPQSPDMVDTLSGYILCGREGGAVEQ